MKERIFDEEAKKKVNAVICNFLKIVRVYLQENAPYESISKK